MSPDDDKNYFICCKYEGLGAYTMHLQQCRLKAGKCSAVLFCPDRPLHHWFNSSTLYSEAQLWPPCCKEGEREFPLKNLKQVSIHSGNAIRAILQPTLPSSGQTRKNRTEWDKLWMWGISLGFLWVIIIFRVKTPFKVRWICIESLKTLIWTHKGVSPCKSSSDISKTCSAFHHMETEPHSLACGLYPARAQSSGFGFNDSKLCFLSIKHTHLYELTRTDSPSMDLMMGPSCQATKSGKFPFLTYADNTAFIWKGHFPHFKGGSPCVSVHVCVCFFWMMSSRGLSPTWFFQEPSWLQWEQLHDLFSFFLLCFS